jgi:protein-L-isoaspartate(D-aspartate) O-methyltransferase
MTSDAQGRARLALALRKAGVTEPQVLDAIERTPRDLFVGRTFQPRAFEDTALPIECGQTISQPYVVGAMTAALEVGKRDKVLEVGTGSGYQTAILARLARWVYTVERYRTLSRQAQARFGELGLTNIVAKVADGAQGWPEQAPFDRILITAATPGEPSALLDQLKPGGVCVAPVGAGQVQDLVRYRKDEAGLLAREVLMQVRFVPLLPGVAREA